jgi:GT2 family glycosyltransferase
MRARLLGWKAWYVPTAVVHHRHSATAGAYSPLKVMLVERNRLLLAIKNFTLSLLIQNPYWSLRRFGWHAYAALRRRGSAGQFVGAHGWSRALGNLAWSYFSAARLLPEALRRRRQIQRTKRLSNREVRELLRRFQIDLRELTLKD